MRLTVTDEAFPYLVVQRGRLDHLKHDRLAWEAAYHTELRAEWAAIEPQLPDVCHRLMDVGGGMAGLAAMVARHYPDGAVIELLDGVADPAHVRRHNETFSNYLRANRFLRANGVEVVVSNDPRFAAGYVQSKHGAMDWKLCDLILSTQAWGFHFAPELYLDYVRARRAPGAPVILDVRRSRRDWFDAFANAFGAAERIAESAKYDRYVFA